MIQIQRIELSVTLTVLIISLMTYTKQYCCDARAIMVEPPHRSSLWRFNYNTSVNLRDDGLNCGGYDWQWGVHRGRCGVCGDLWNGTQHNADGIYNSGIIVRRYTDGHYINITFEVSSNYLGYVEFRLCPRNSSHQQLTQSCFDRYPLWIDESHGTRYYIGSRGGIYDIHIRLPGGLVCRNCVLQWKYKTGYRYNGDETCKCLGCGKQEQYINCADIEITPTEGWPRDSKGPGRDGTKPRDTGFSPKRHDHIHPTRASDISTTISSSKPSSPLTFPFGHTTEPLPVSSLDLSSANLFATSVTSSSKASFIQTNPSLSIAQSVSTIKLSNTSSFNLEHAPSSLIPNTSQQVLTLDAIRREIVKKLGNDVANSMKIFFAPPSDAGQVQTVTSRPSIGPTPQGDSFPSQPKKPEVPNTQFVSVSNILDRFYPNYMAPLIFSLARSQSANGKSTVPCDINSDEFRCKARGIYKQSPGISRWCEINCRASNCVTFMCECSCEDKSKSQNSSCHAIAEFQGVEGMDQWCVANCKVGYCPANTCSVEDCMRRPSNGEI